MSFSASPGWKSESICAPSAAEAPRSACGATPNGRPIAHAEVKPSARKPRLSSGERLSRP